MIIKLLRLFGKRSPKIGETWILKKDDTFKRNLYADVIDINGSFIKYEIRRDNTEYVTESSLRLSEFILIYEKHGKTWRNKWRINQ